LELNREVLVEVTQCYLVFVDRLENIGVYRVISLGGEFGDGATVLLDEYGILDAHQLFLRGGLGLRIGDVVGLEQFVHYSAIVHLFQHIVLIFH